MLADNRRLFQLELVRERVPDVDATLKRLVAIGVLEADELEDTRRLVHSDAAASKRADPPAAHDEEDSRASPVQRFEFPGVEIATRLTRFYPHGEHAVHALGYVAAISEGDVKKRIDADGQVRRHHADRQARRRGSSTRRSCTAATASSSSW